MSADHSHLRTTLLGSLLDGARTNIARGLTDVALFESGAIYLDLEPADDAARLSADGDPVAPVLDHDAGQPLERHALGGLVVGRRTPETWRGTTEPWDFFALKGVVAAVLDTLRVEWDARPPGHPFLHPGRAARIFAGETELGWLGELHPLVARAWDIEAPAAAFELDVDLVVAEAPEVPHYRDVTSFPAVRQDLAVVVPDDVPAATVLDTVRRAAGALLESVEVFDVYRGAQVGEGRVSLALHLAFRAPDRTLTDEEVADRVRKAVDALGELGAELRA
jgi:phenylalanyl-tRNA synthetase beta chain